MTPRKSQNKVIAPDHRNKIIIALVVVIILMVLFYTLFGRNKKSDEEYKAVINAMEQEVSYIRQGRALDSLRMVKQDSLISIYAKQVVVRNYYIGQNKEKIKQLDKEINETIPDLVRNLSKDSLRSAATD